MQRRLIDVLQALQIEQGHSALQQTPIAGREAFEYGRAQGIYLGLQLALDAVNQAFEADEDADDHGRSRRGGKPYLTT